MLVNATLVPDTVLLVPGASGATPVLADVRTAAVDAVRALLASRPDRVVVVTPGPRDRTRSGPFAPSLAAAGIPDDVLGWHAPSVGGAEPVTATAGSAVLLLLAHAGWSGPVTLLEVSAPGDDPATRAPGRAAGLAALGRGATRGPERVGLLAGGSLSARHGQEAPLAGDPRAAAADRAVLADLGHGGPAARERLAAWDPGVAADLVVTAWAPLQVVLGAAPADAPVDAAVHGHAAPWGIPYVVASWRPS